ncbi:hypothetical protein GRB70_40210 [Bradyrhizobium neotropicale]|nr:hypothetical protein [Bradyrhizobium neotropicale]
MNARAVVRRAEAGPCRHFEKPLISEPLPRTSALGGSIHAAAISIARSYGVHDFVIKDGKLDTASTPRQVLDSYRT